MKKEVCHPNKIHCLFNCLCYVLEPIVSQLSKHLSSPQLNMYFPRFQNLEFIDMNFNKWSSLALSSGNRLLHILKWHCTMRLVDLQVNCKANIVAIASTCLGLIVPPSQLVLTERCSAFNSRNPGRTHRQSIDHPSANCLVPQNGSRAINSCMKVSLSLLENTFALKKMSDRPLVLWVSEPAQVINRVLN